MATEPQQKETLETEGIPSLYCNHANLTISYLDVRVYLSATSPKEIDVNPGKDKYVQTAPRLEPQCALVLSPEFARQLAKALNSTVEQYEHAFGSLRPEPTPETIAKAMAIETK